jgi:molybdopterin-containing oxidoreductase family membrane subunit
MHEPDTQPRIDEAPPRAATAPQPLEEAPLTGLTYQSVNRDIIATLSPPGRFYWMVVFLLAAIFGWGMLCWGYMILRGLGVAGITHPVAWGVFIVTFVFWVGIAHSGTLISAVLFLFRARWRTAVYRAAEAMTVIAVTTAGMFPLIHLGRVWKFYWLLPYPNQRYLWPNFKSPLMWDVLAVSTYLTISAVFLYVGLIPDVAAVRDRSTGWRHKAYSILSLGWRGSTRTWRHYMKGYLLFAAIATPLVVSVHSVVSWDFAMSIVPGWHSTIFAPYFVAGAIHSGLAMVLTLLIPLRRIFRVKHIITVSHLEAMAKIIIVTGLIVGYAYVVEYFVAIYSANIWEQAIFKDRFTGAYAWAGWLMVICNSIIPLALLFKRVRRSIPWLFAISLFVNLGMWFERFVIIVGSLSHDYMPYAWGLYKPTWVELSILIGSFAWFFMLFLLFAKHLPSISMTEIKEILPPPEKEGAS